MELSGLTDFGLKMALNEKVQSPNTLLVTNDSFASLVLGFPELGEFRLSLQMLIYK